MENIIMKSLSIDLAEKKTRPIKVLQFGEGNFLRAFVEYMIDVSNEKGLTDIGVVIVKPIEFGTLERFKKQDNLYNVVLRGRDGGKIVDDIRLITCVEDVVSPYTDPAKYEEYILLDTLQFIVSNTTEAGIVYDDTDRYEMEIPKSYPGKLTKLLYQRYTHFKGDKDKGLVILPCELIENNGKVLKECVFKLIDLWKLEDSFKEWVLKSVIFCSTLVDRIVTGYPGEDAPAIWEKIGYQDDLLAVGEPFGFWVIESDKDISEKLPLDKAGLPVVFTSDQRPYRERKVRILNGGHTTMVLAAYLAGKDIVRDCMQDDDIRTYLERILNEEIIPTLTLPKQELEEFSNSVIERFNNPFIDHQLLSISLNSVSKWKARVLPSFKDYYQSHNQKCPKLIAFSMAALIAFYNGSEIRDGKLVGVRDGKEYNIIDSPFILEFFKENSSLPADQLTKKVLENKDFWGEDLTQYVGFEEMVTKDLENIRKNGAADAIKAILE